MANRLGELRHEEFSHSYVHGSVGRGKFRRTLLCNFFQDYHFKIFGERRRTNSECKRNSEKLLFFCFVSRFVRDETELKEPLNVTNDTV